MLEGLNRESISNIYKTMDFKEYLSTAIDSSYDGLAMFRPTVEHISDYSYQDMFTGGTIVKFSHFDGEYPMFNVITSSSRHLSSMVFIPFPLLQKMSSSDFKPWAEGAILRDNITDRWLLVVDYTSDCQVVTQDLKRGDMAIKKMEDVTHGKRYRSYGSAPYPVKGTHGVKLNAEQAKAEGLPEGTIAPFAGYHTNPGGEVLVEMVGCANLIPYSKAEMTNASSFYFGKLIDLSQHYNMTEDDF